MAGKTLATTVHVYDDETGLVVLNPGDTVPAKYSKQVTNPKAFEDGDESNVNEDTTTDPGSAPAAGSAGAPPKGSK